MRLKDVEAKTDRCSSIDSVSPLLHNPLSGGSGQVMPGCDHATAAHHNWSGQKLRHLFLPHRIRYGALLRTTRLFAHQLYYDLDPSLTMMTEENQILGRELSFAQLPRWPSRGQKPAAPG